MAGRGRWRSRVLVRCGLVLGVLCSGSASYGLEIMMRQQAWGWEGGFGQPFIMPVQIAPTQQTQDGFVVSASGTAIQDTPAGEALKLIEAGK